MSSIPTLSWYRGKCHLSTWTCSAACDSVGTDYLKSSRLWPAALRSRLVTLPIQQGGCFSLWPRMRRMLPTRSWTSFAQPRWGRTQVETSCLTPTQVEVQHHIPTSGCPYCGSANRIRRRRGVRSCTSRARLSRRRARRRPLRSWHCWPSLQA